MVVVFVARYWRAVCRRRGGHRPPLHAPATRGRSGGLCGAGHNLPDRFWGEMQVKFCAGGDQFDNADVSQLRAVAEIGEAEGLVLAGFVCGLCVFLGDIPVRPAGEVVQVGDCVNSLSVLFVGLGHPCDERGEVAKFVLEVFPLFTSEKLQEAIELCGADVTLQGFKCFVDFVFGFHGVFAVLFLFNVFKALLAFVW